jgi:hypothetical protein
MMVCFFRSFWLFKTGIAEENNDDDDRTANDDNADKFDIACERRTRQSTYFTNKTATGSVGSTPET